MLLEGFRNGGTQPRGRDGKKGYSPPTAKEEWNARFSDEPAVGGHRNPTGAAVIDSVYESAGRLVSKLDGLKLSENAGLFSQATVGAWAATAKRTAF